MGRLIKQQAVIDCLTNTAKYYEREDADEWTKGIHYGLLHGVDNVLDNIPTVEAILKADAENILDEIKTELYATAEMHDDGDYYLREEWIGEIFDKYKLDSEDI